MKEDLLDLVFEENETVFRNDLGFKIGERRKTRTIMGNNRYVEFVDNFGNNTGKAKEIRPVFSDPYVEFYDKDGNPIGRAYVDPKINGKRMIRYTNCDGTTLTTRYVDEDAVCRNNVVSMETTGCDDTHVHADPGVSEIASVIPGVLMVSVFISIIMNAAFAALYDHLDAIVHYGGILCVYASCPMMVLLYLAKCQIPKNAPRELRRFRNGHILLAVFGFGILAALHAIVFFNIDISIMFPSYMIESGIVGLLHFLLCFVPTLIYGIVSGIWTLLKRKTAYYSHCTNVSVVSMTLMTFSNIALVSITQLIMLCHSYTPGDFGRLILMILAVPFLALLIFLAAIIARLPYSGFSHFF